MALVSQKPFNLDLSRLQYEQSHDQGGFNPEANCLPDGFPIARVPDEDALFFNSAE
jgi:hypothetical protein